MGIDMKLVGSRIRSARKHRNMSAEMLAEQLGIATESLLHIECGSRKPSLNTMYNISEILDVSMDFLAGRSDRPESIISQEEIESEDLTSVQAAALKSAAQALMPIIKKLV